MLEFKNNPRELMQALDRFLSVYFGDLQVEYKPDLDEIAAWNIPQPLKDVYSFIGKFQGQLGFLDSNQNTLIINRGDSFFGGKLYIVGEHSGCWTCCTEFEGEDPPVWTEYYGWQADSPKWKLVHKSLSQFLVGFCLEEAIMASRYRQKIGSFNISIPSKEVISAINSQDYDVSLLWQDNYIWQATIDEPISIDRYMRHSALGAYACGIPLGTKGGIRMFVAEPFGSQRAGYACSSSMRHSALGADRLRLGRESVRAFGDEGAKLRFAHWDAKRPCLC